MYGTNIGFIVEGHCEYEAIPSFIGKILGTFNFPIQNAKGIGNIIKNIDKELLLLVKTRKPKNIIISLDASDAIRDGFCKTCIELKEKIMADVRNFIKSQENGSLELPQNIVVVIADKSYDTWLCSDMEGLKNCKLIDATKIIEKYQNVDQEIASPSFWIKTKLKKTVDFKNRRHRKLLASSVNPEVGINYSPSFNKFIKEVKKHVE